MNDSTRPNQDNFNLDDRQGAGGYGTNDKPARLFATIVGATFLLVGVLGFIPGITTNAADITFNDHHSDTELLGIFQVSILHNIVHLLFGIAGLAMARKASTAIAYLIGGGVIYLVLWIYGLVIDQHSDANFVPVNDADNWLHFVLGIGMIALGLVARRAWRGSAAQGIR